METIIEARRATPVAGEFDVCVVGGSCTGVFAAVRAARLGASVCIIEKANSFGGVATAGLVNVWHSLLDTVGEQPIIGGLTREVIDRLQRRAAAVAVGNASVGHYLNTEELKIELDELVVASGVRPFLHSVFSAAHHEDSRLAAVVFECKGGRRAVRARVFIDATGDGDLAAACGAAFTVGEHLQPPTTCAKIHGMAAVDVAALFREHREEFGLVPDSGWIGSVPHLDALRMYALTHCFDTNAADADQLTAAEIEGRRQIRAIMDIVRKYGRLEQPPVLAALPSSIGIRETRIFATRHVLTEQEVLSGHRFPDAVANGSYRVDIHHPSGGGFIFKYLDGTTIDSHLGKRVEGRWRDPLPDGQSDPTFYQAPLGCLQLEGQPNLLLAGRMVGADRGAFGALRVMVNLNQLGEAAGTAAALAFRQGVEADAVAADEVRAALAEGGSIIF